MTDQPPDVTVLVGATLADGTVVDVTIAGGVIEDVVPVGARTAIDAVTIDLDGYVLLTAPAEPHAHLDKALTFDAIAPPAGGLAEAVASFHAFAHIETQRSITERGRAALLRMLAAGTTAVRTHVNAYPGDDALRGVHAMVALREEFRDLLDLEVVALPSWDTPGSWTEDALDAGADLVGGAPHMAPEPLVALDALLDIAERRGCGVDLHTDESLHGPDTLLRYAQRTADWRVVRSAGHCVRLGMMGPAELAPVVTAVRDAGIGIITLPITNLYLQGRDHAVATPRGLTAVRALLDAGVKLAAGADNLRDPFNPMGRGDALETASLLVTAGHLGIDEAVHAITDGARDVLGLPKAGPRVGAAAELLAVRASSLGEAVAFAPADRIVFHQGRVVATSHVSTTIAHPRATAPRPTEEKVTR